MCDYSEYDEDVPGITYVTEQELFLLEPGDILIDSTATDDNLIELIEYLIKTRNLSWE